MKSTIIVMLLATVLTQARATGCLRGDLRISGPKERSGVEICIDNIWRTLCTRKSNGDRDWDTQAANVACKQLGYLEIAAISEIECLAPRGDNYATITGSCTGQENSLHECGTNTGTPNNLCRGCSGKDRHANLTCLPADCSKSALRLVNGTSYREGRVEVCVDGRWGTVCGEGWTNEDAGHVCEYLGYPREEAEIRRGHFSPGTAPVRNCTDKTNISTCTLPVTDCNHTMDLGVVCKSYDQVAEIIINRTINETKQIIGECPTTSSNEITSDMCNNQNTPMNGQSGAVVTSECPSSGQCDIINSVLGVLVGLLTALLVALLVTVTVVVRRHKLHNKQQAKQMLGTQSTEMTSTDNRALTNPVYGANVSATHPHNDYGSSGPAYEAVTNDNQTYSTLNHEPNNNNNKNKTKNNVVRLSTVEEHDYHVLESNDRESVECEGVYSVASEGVYSVATGEGVYSVASEGAGCEGVCSDYEVPRDSKVWLNQDEYSTLKH